MDSSNLLRQIRKYSLIKTWGVLPFSIMAILATITFTLLSILSQWIGVPGVIMMVSAGAMMLGIVVPLLAIFIWEKARESLTNPNNNGQLMNYIELASAGNIKSDFLYYDVIELFYNVVRKIYLYGGNKDKRLEQISSSLNIIFRENSRAGLANRFIYQNKKGFRELCKYIIEYYQCKEINGEDIMQASSKIYNRYLDEIKKGPILNIPEAKQRLIPKRVFRNAKIVLLFSCVVFYWFPQINSYVFNFVAIVLLLLDIVQGNDRDLLMS